MELTNRYVYKIYQNGSFSKAAKELFISQPSLSTMVKRLENQLGFEIFDRSKTPLSLTPKGEIYIEYIEKAIENENNMKSRIKGMSKQPNERLIIAGTNYLSNKLFPKACGELHKRYPNVEIVVNFGSDASKEALFNRLNQGTIDLVLNYTCDKSRFSYVPLQKERFIIAVRRYEVQNEKLLTFAVTHEEVVSKNIPKEKEISDFTLFKDVKFLKVSKSSSIQQYMAKFTENSVFSTASLYNAKAYDVHYNMMMNGLGAVITTDFMIENTEKNEDILFFVTSGTETSREAKILYKSDKPLSRAAKEFISIATEMIKDKSILK